MTISAATPYLILNGHAASAIEHYQQALGAKLESSARFGDMDKSCPAAQRDRIMHAALKLGTATLMLSDGVQDTVTGGAVHIALNFDDVDEARRCFAALSEGGKVQQELMEAPWGALFGAVDDKFGVPFMFNCELKR